jgi:hypothetical protein
LGGFYCNHFLAQNYFHDDNDAPREIDR